jgi:hypothetical protein
VAAPELSGIAVVGTGSFNPAIIHPRWLADKELIRENEAEHAMRPSDGQQMIVSPQISVFVADWLAVQVTQDKLVLSTLDEGRAADLRDVSIGILQFLPETPVDAIGINSDTHFRVANDEAWHAFGDRFLPKDIWTPLFKDGHWLKRKGGEIVGMRVLSIEVWRDDDKLPGFVRVEVAPSVRVSPNGVYVGINAHFQLKRSSDARPTADDARLVVGENWEATRELEKRLVAQILEIA